MAVLHGTLETLKGVSYHPLSYCHRNSFLLTLTWMLPGPEKKKKKLGKGYIRHACAGNGRTETEVEWQEEIPGSEVIGRSGSSN